MRRKTLWFVSLILIFTTQCYSQQKKNISLAEAVQLSLQNSKQIKLDTAKIQEAVAAVKIAEEKKLPGASVAGSYMYLSNADVSLKTKSSGSGGSSGGAAETPKVSQVMYGMANVSMPVFTGGKINYGIEAARFLEKAAQLDAEFDKGIIIQNTIEAYGNLYKARVAALLMQENLLQAQSRVADFGNLEKNGLLPRNDVMKAMLQASNIELGLLDAKNSLQLAITTMNLMLGLSLDTQLEIDSSDMDPTMSTKNIADYIFMAQNNRKDIASVNEKLGAATSGVKIAKAERFPNIQVTGGYVAAHIPGFLTVTNAVNIGVGINYDIASLWKTKAKINQAQAKADAVQAQAGILSDQVTLQVNKSFLDVQSSTRKIEVSELAYEQAAENQRIIKNKFDNSLATPTELLEADYAMLQAKMNFAVAKTDACIARNKLLQITGTIAENYK